VTKAWNKFRTQSSHVQIFRQYELHWTTWNVQAIYTRISRIFCLLESFRWFPTCFHPLSKSTDDLSIVRLQSIQHRHENVQTSCVPSFDSRQHLHKPRQNFHGFLAEFKTKYHVRSLFVFIALHVLRQRCETYSLHSQ
jgi:hypothetical protein